MSGPSNLSERLTHDAVVRRVGDLDDAKIAEILATGATVAELEEAIAAGAGRALLDNMDVDTLRDAVRVGKGRIVLEASGGLRPGNLEAAARTGVEFLSLGWLTHSAPAADIAMEMEFRS